MKKTIQNLYTGLLVALLLLAVIPVPAFAAPFPQEDPEAKADRLKSQGDEFLELERYEEALDHFEAALPLYQQAGERVGEGWCLLAIAYTKSKLEDHSGAIQAYLDSLPVWQEARDSQMEATTLNNIGVEYDTLGEKGKALLYFKEALAISQKINDPYGERVSLVNIGQIYEEQGEYKQALTYYQPALEISQQIGNQDEELDLLGDIGEGYRKLGQYRQALDYYQQAHALAQKTGKQEIEGTMLNNIGIAQRRLGQYDQALASLQKALTLAKQNGDQAAEAKTLTNFGLVYDDLGQYEQALTFYHQSLNKQNNHDQVGKAITLNNIGSVYRNLGQSDQALNYHQQALNLIRQLREESEANLEASTLNNIGLVYGELHQYDQALMSLQEGLVIAEQSGDEALEGNLKLNMGFVLGQLGEPLRALDYYQQALRIVQQTGNRAAEVAIHNNLGITYSILGEPQKMVLHLEDALEIAQDIGDQAGKRNALSNMGFFHELQGDIGQAIINYQQAVEATESMQREITIEELKASFAAEHMSEYQHVIRLLWDQKRFKEAFDYAERSRARAFLDQLAGGAIDYRAGADADLLKREQALQDEIVGLRTQLISLRNRPIDEWDTNAIATVESNLSTREADYTQLLTDIKLQSPEVAGLVSVDVASLADVQNLLDANTTLIEYFVMEDRTLAFIITHDTFEAVGVDVNQEDLSQTIHGFRDFASRDDPYPSSLEQLYTWLIVPLKDKLQTSMIGIIPHGTLHYLPFAALTDGERYFGEQYSLFTLPSASALRFIQEKRKPQTSTILALGNPTITQPGLGPLESAAQEVEAITTMFGTEPLIGESATESALRSRASTAGIVHLAAHGQYNASNPLFSVIYLAAGGEEDGRLQVNEIYGLDLTNATDLVVLSACETQVGEISAGDEVVGMTRAFLYAGTPSVIASLWKVDDEATTLLMERFYTHLREGMGKAQALQAAQSELRAEYPIEYDHPYYWAAFVLTGDPGETVPQESTPSPVTTAPSLWLAGSLLLVGLCCLGLVTVLVGAIFWWRRRKRVPV